MGSFDHPSLISSVQDDAAKPMLWSPRPAVSGCRLSLDRTLSVPSADQTNKAVIFVVPHASDTIECWSGEDWVPRPLPYDLGATQTAKTLALDISDCVTATTHDVFVRNVSGQWEIKFQEWGSTTARYSGGIPNGPNFHPDGLGLFQGRLVAITPHPASSGKCGSIQPDWLYLGTFYTSAAGKVDDRSPKRFLWNLFNQVPRPFLVRESTASWTYSGTTIRQANASSANQVACVTGLTQYVAVRVMMGFGNTASDFEIGIGVDSTTTFHSNGLVQYGGGNMNLEASLRHAALGYRTYKWNEHSPTGAAAATIYGDGGADRMQSGIDGEVWA